MRIVYVEDNQANVFLVRRVARAGGHDVINYIDGEEALSNITHDKPDLILMDIQLAGMMSGLEVVERLRSDGFTAPIVAVTAYAMIGDRERCMEAGCTDYIAKPLSIPRLLELIEHYNVSKTTATSTSTHPTVAAEAAPEASATPTPEADTSAAPTPDTTSTPEAAILPAPIKSPEGLSTRQFPALGKLSRTVEKPDEEKPASSQA